MNLSRIVSTLMVMAAFSPTAGVAQTYDQGERTHGQTRYQSEGSSPAGPYQDSDRQGRRSDETNQDWGPAEQGRRSEHLRIRRSASEATPRGARFRVEMGDASVDVRCPSSDDFQSCVEAAGLLVEKLGSHQTGAQRSSVEKGGGPIISPSQTIPAPPAEPKP